MSIGKVYLIGAGPGDPGLLTLKGKRCLEEADAIIYDYLVDPRILAFARSDAELVYAGKKSQSNSIPQSEINRMMVERALAGQTVARLKGGDPFIFGRGGEEAEELVAAHVPFEVIPGVSSAIAAPAYAGIPVSHRHHASAVAIVSGHKEVWENAPHLNWATLAGVGGTLVLLMSTRQLRTNMQRLINHGLPAHTPVALIRWGTRPDQEVVTGTVGTIADLAAERGFEPPAVTVVGDVVRLRERLRWFDTKPLFGKRIVVTRPRAQAGNFIELLEQQGAEVILCPTIETVPLASYERLDKALDEIASYAWVIFTSVNGVKFFFARLRERTQDIRTLGAVRIAAIGPETARAVEQLSLRVEAMPDEYRAEAVVPTLGNVKGQRILLPRAAEARAILPQALRVLGAQVDEIAVYQTIRPQETTAEPLQALFEQGKIDLVTFTSSSTVRNFVSLFPTDDIRTVLGATRVGCIGPITADTAREYGLEVAVQPSSYTVSAFAEAIVAYFGKSEQESIIEPLSD
ncbi:MAG TPA: uroporphyrinogen-III C-methyltransferase [Methylomirabilota bacterium]|jgi:uroporphyrinogen III methyltransferase/synthase|nr:uroporphyrinogen-III C-methyltransferase [Methylomirabilota bacterium]